ncbi:hypothetical protein CDAR_76761 [Caerostris darwini]|uniref:Uncharacterized protein n=1 Tax=Caerostris darwini TaxID=1538125 RepID=A0AAV4QFN9_9ARAC|nr:hypothetical protein CDAR_76761 [Caerostris darwini]
MQMPSASLSLPHAIQSKAKRLADAPGGIAGDAQQKREKCLVATVTCCGDTLGIFRLASIASLGRLGNERAIFCGRPISFPAAATYRRRLGGAGAREGHTQPCFALRAREKLPTRNNRRLLR